MASRVLATVFAAALFASCACKEVTPKAKWGQDLESLYLTLTVFCDRNHRDVVITNSSFSFSCKTRPAHTTAVLQFHFREDVLPNDPRTQCRFVKQGIHGAEEVCTFVKSEPHIYDALVSPADAGRLKSTLKVNWDRWPAETPAPPIEDPFNLPSASIIQPIASMDELNAAVAKHGAVFLDVSPPWCDVCYAARSHFVEAASRIVTKNELASRLGDNPLPLFGRVDVRESPELRWMFNATCRNGILSSGPSKPCGFVAVTPNQSPHFVKEKFTANDLIASFVTFLGDKYRVITNEQQLQDFRRVAPVTLLAVFPSEADENYGKFLPMIDDIRAKFPVAVTTTEAVITSVHYLLLSSVEGFPKDEVANVMFVLFKPESDGSFAIWSTIKNGGLSSVSSAKVIQWAEANRRALIADYSWGVRDDIDAAKIPVAMIFVDDEADPKLKDFTQLVPPAIKAVAPTFRGRLVFMTFRKSVSGYMMTDLFPAPHVFPSFAITSSFRHEDNRWAYDETDPNSDNKTFVFTEQAIAAFCNSVLDGALPPARRSEPIPASPFQAGKLNKLVWRSLHTSHSQSHNVIDLKSPNAPDLLVYVYNMYQQSRNSILPLLERVANATVDVPGFLVATYDAGANYVDPSLVTGFDENNVTSPYLYLVSGRGAGYNQTLSPIDADTATSQPKLLTFLKSHVPSVAAAWDAVKQRIKDQNNEIRKKKEAAKAAAEREAALLETAAKIDVSGDGGVIVQMISSPAAALDADDPLLSVQYPKLTPTSRVRVHYTGSLVDGKVFDSSERNPEPSEFTLGGGLIKCWNIGLPTLRVGDVAMLTCTSEYGYGSHGSPPRIPADATLKFRIRVVSVAPVEPSETERDSSVGADSEEL